MTGGQLRRRYGRVFDQIDIDGDGIIFRGDFEQMARSLAHTFDLPASSPKAHAILDHYRRTWAVLCEDLGIEETGQIGRDDFEAAMTSLAAQDSFLQHAREVAAAEFALADQDDDGQLAQDEFVRLIEAFGPSREEARASFSHLDRDDDGQIGREEYVVAWREYISSEDENAPGSWLFGSPG
ncbi:Ca2+-binding protein, EF-hand superfamily [Streptoalloteichus tenebrarius]|uniref:Ca2+-binding protein, EF-hand superfamily n=1 Tax=Streptoalloteichus tenebrarius (strain ATCC 17920 / DSM 40477 / JCM 4838 / CBS 697.72 / NBRC 16177 / NCIMB 11028 / NRRL B-12390 / A12253. 1 / ISP 5477) TaxID=1933 RepID=A0ABT1I191_STRSD|nr:EF-hand domain-containing protein [Streptoalloteichus tenebrarius]MCP2261521.1 Ca2+-binding protein, EF-hand superfamily [Streptoalloteichus tenebrarius]BFE99319.1 hypothetical protein GCM10020241_09950 [Streptoalloteichus tenebrarius]